VIAAIWAGKIALRTLRAIEQQTAVSIKKERARLTVQILRRGHMLSEDSWTVAFKISNLGSTHAFNVVVVVAYELAPSNEPAVASSLVEFPMPNVIKAGDEQLSDELLPDASTNPSVTYEDVLNNTVYPQFWGKVTYDDVFGNHQETPFRYIWKVDRFEVETDDGGSDWVDESKWVTHGPASDNTAT
jgi:hypothetical protein